ncbi:hypothetical protein ABZ070_24560 [Streptomyces sp. NPDC006283]|uniref:TetR/AcrR family transcriptional regulator n=1 Tax=Streptomyces sp. NPDC006283 TaxID=3156741 RepID=UPI0033B843E1
MCPGAAGVPCRAALIASQIPGRATARYVLRLPSAVDMAREEAVGRLAGAAAAVGAAPSDRREVRTTRRSCGGRR